VSDLPPLVSGLTDAAWLAAQLNEKLHAAFSRAPIDPSAALAEIDAKIQAQFSTINLLVRHPSNRARLLRCRF
jgi:hypothetical protein